MELSSNLDPKPRTLNDFFPEANQNSLQPTLSRSNGNFINIYVNIGAMNFFCAATFVAQLRPIAHLSF